MLPPQEKVGLDDDEHDRQSDTSYPESTAPVVDGTGLERSLSAYLRSARSGQVVVLGKSSHPEFWSDSSEDDGLVVLDVDALTECLQTGSLAGNVHRSAPSIAWLQLDSDEAFRSDCSVQTTLGQAMRLFPDRLVVSTHSPEPDDATFFALGFHRLMLPEQGSTRLFEYSLSEYKQPPEWLNARFWAHPERFDLDKDLDDSDEYSDEEE
ncbi:MAG: hypothetical protein HKN42_16090 [Granulosicoccus sp.]|nr:hypothetical protein [Granulosicoccus sp.]